MRRSIVLAFLLLGLLATSVVSAEEAPQFVWMIYMCGSDLESETGAATDDLYEIMSAFQGGGASLGQRIRAGLSSLFWDQREALGNDVLVLVETGGANHWTMPAISSDFNQRHVITANRLDTLADTSSLRNMGEADTLAAFIAYGFERYPADRYGLILWDHGGGPLYGMCYDERFNDDVLTLTEIHDALAQGVPPGKRFDFIGFDACLMNSVEVLLAVAPFADYVIASQESTTESGFDYDTVLADLLAHPTMETDALARQMVDRYIADNTYWYGYDTATLSVLRTDHADELQRALDDLGKALIATGLDGQWEAIIGARATLRSFGEYIEDDYDPSDLVDVYSLCEAFADLAPEATKALYAAASDTIVYALGTKDIAAYAGGLSVFMPYATVETYAEDIYDVYTDVCPAKAYRQLVLAMTLTLDPYA